MKNENLIIDCNEVSKLRKDYPKEMEVIIKMLTEVGEGCHFETAPLEAVVAS
ncbi:MAG: hypothetical protein KAG20_06585 [Cocleimonas sp.]|nr:hypothetical protein [Cocleimonas sp.]